MRLAGFWPRDSDEEPPGRGVWGYVVCAGSLDSSLDYRPWRFDSACPNREARDYCIFKEE